MLFIENTRPATCVSDKKLMFKTDVFYFEEFIYRGNFLDLYLVIFGKKMRISIKKKYSKSNVK